MTALLVAAGALALWSLLGLGILCTLRADVQSLRLVLTAPALGLSALTLAVFLLSRAGLAVRDFAIPLTVGAIVLAVVAVALRRPRIPASALPVALIAVIAIALAGSPMLTFGFDWIANANDDMANYVLAATQLFNHGFSAPLNVVGLLHGSDYPTTASVFQRIGARPGAQLDLAWLHGVTGRDEREAFMPLIVAMHGCGVCGAGALAMQATRRTWAAAVAAGLLAVSPLATFAVLQQLISQVFGVALALALLAVLMAGGLHRGQRPRRSELVIVALLVAGIAIAYIELASILAVACALYVILLAVRGRFALRPVLQVCAVAAAFVLILLNSYVFEELHFVHHQAQVGLSESAGAAAFPLISVPAALPAIVGLTTLSTDAPQLALKIVIAAALLVALLAAALVQAWKTNAAAVVAVVGAALAVVLAINHGSFGLFKLSMYMQPFLAVIAAIALANARSLWLRAVVALCVAGVVAGSLSSQHSYAARSRNPIDLRNASSDALLPAFRKAVADERGPIVAVTDNPVLIKLEAADALNHAIQFLSRDVWASMLKGTFPSGSSRRTFDRVRHLYAWPTRSFRLNGAPEMPVNHFSDNRRASVALRSPGCRLAVVTGSQSIVNRRSLPEGMPDLVFRGCRDVPPLLVFTHSTLGESFYLFSKRRNVSFYQLENDYFFTGHTMSGAGRYALFRLLGPSRRVRVAVEVTSTFLQHESYTLPRASIAGVSRQTLQLVGRGSARVFSAPLQPQMIAGHPYLMLDMGRAGRRPTVPRHGVEALWGGSIPLDPRYLTAYMRDVSVITDADYRRLHPPRALTSFPRDLANPDLQYSGIYEDGWVSEHAYAILGGGPAADLVVEGDVPQGAGGRLDVLLDGRSIAVEVLKPGKFTVRVAAPASQAPRRVELRFSSAPQLPEPDGRPAAAFLRYVGFESGRG